MTAPSLSHNRKPLVEPALRIPLLLELPEPWQTLAINLFQRLIAVRKVNVTKDTERRLVSPSIAIPSTNIQGQGG